MITWTCKTITYSALVMLQAMCTDSITRTVTVQAKPLGLVTLTIESDNAQNNLYAKIGDEITITLVANGTIGSATTTTIASNTITPVLTGSTLVASYIVDSHQFLRQTVLHLPLTQAMRMARKLWYLQRQTYLTLASL